jgi:hypothetical protein
MANIKTGLAFYRIDTDRYQDIRIKRLKKTFGCMGVAVYDYVLCEIYRVRGCFIGWDESTAFDVAEYFNLKETQVNEVINYCCAVGLFNKGLLASGRILTSESIQKRYIEMCTRAKRRDVIIPEEYKIIHEQCQITQEVCDKEEYIRVKKRKKEILSDESTKKDSHESSRSPDYEKFLIWINKHAPYCSDTKNFPHQISEEELARLKEKYTGQQVADVIEQIENRKDLRKRYTNLYRTVLNWAKKEYKDG